ncbi:MAG: glycine--tRNA ligase subunit beta, partial [Chloroflexota bacterium]
PPADKAIVGQIGNLSYTPAAQGFAKKNGVDTKDLVVREEGGGKYVFAVVKSTGRPAAEVLAEALPGLVASINFTKSMRWNDSGVAFSRPIRWLVALLGGTVIPFEYAGVASGSVTRGLRPYDSPEIVVPSADSYFDVVREAGIVIDVEERKRLIAGQVKQAAASVNGEALIPDDLLAEVANLVEKPTAVLGGFPEGYLSLPRDVLISVMKKHQRYFPVQHPTHNTLLPHFIAIRNGDGQHLDLVRQGNEHVLNARFADADFFVREDLKRPLEFYRPGLGKLIFQTALGSMLDKSGRMIEFAEQLAPMLILTEHETRSTQRAVFLAKCDLATQMVAEMTSLQGIIGREYALRGGESPEVAEAIGEQYQSAPKTKPGVALALADRIDSLVGLFAAGLAPTGAKDPFALRRAAIGVVQPLIEHGMDFDLRQAVAQAAKLQPIEVSDEVQNQVLDFIAGRLSVLLKESYRYDVVDAVLAAQSDNPSGAAKAVAQLQAWVRRADWDSVLPGYARCVRIIRSAGVSGVQYSVSSDRLVEAAEKALYAEIQKTMPAPRSTVDEILNIVVALIPAINKFFDEVLVMAEDEAVRQNRLALVGQIAGLSDGIADLSKLEGF